MPRNVAIRLTGPGKWIPNGGRHCERCGRTISLVMETACRGNRAAAGERKIHSQRQKAPDIGRERGSKKGISNKKKRAGEKEKMRG